ncbi:MAG TPA: efflux RND transporter periplasmic adaptor subunit [Planctomycetota bacterium]
MRPAAVLVLLALAACKPSEQPRPTGAHLRKPRVTAAPAVVREIEYAVEASGSVEASEEIAIPASVAGIVEKVSFKEGDAVTPETVLVEIEVDRFRLGEERAKADLDRARAQAALSETLYSNRQKLSEEGKKAGKEYVTAELMATMRADLEKTKADVQRSQAEWELAKRDHRNARVRSPIRGLIHSKLVSQGEYVKAETVVARILNVSVLHVRFTVPELEASRLVPGQDVRFSVRGAPGVEFKARLFHLSQKADPVTRAIEGKAEVVEKTDGLRAGTFAQVKMTTGRQEGLLVPERALLPTERGFVLFVLDGVKAQSRVVKLGLRLDGLVEIVEGLKRGERVVIDGALTLRDGLEVDLGEPPSPKPPEKGGAGS